MLENQGFKYRAYPTETQQSTLAKWFGCKRFVGNLAIEQRSTFSRRGRSITCAMQMTDLPKLRADLPWLEECPAQILQQALNDIDKAYDRFFQGLGGYPKRKGKYNRNSFRFPTLEQRCIVKKKNEIVVDENGEPVWRTTRLITLNDDWIELPKIGKIRWVKHRPIQGTPKNVTVSHEGGMYFVNICCEVEIDTTKAPEPTVDAIAYDYGVNKNYAMSDGTVFNVPGETEGERRRRLCLEHTIGRQEEARKVREAQHRAAGLLGPKKRLSQSRREKKTRHQLR
jgi:putative transposase